MLELMAYAMVAHDLGLYLDVYPTQTRLIKEFEKYSKLAADRQKAYVEKYGPLSQKDSGDKNGMMSYVATPSPWLGF